MTLVLLVFVFLLLVINGALLYYNHILRSTIETHRLAWVMAQEDATRLKSRLEELSTAVRRVIRLGKRDDSFYGRVPSRVMEVEYNAVFDGIQALLDRISPPAPGPSFRTVTEGLQHHGVQPLPGVMRGKAGPLGDAQDEQWLREEEGRAHDA